jgi:hypothetical protein
MLEHEKRARQEIFGTSLVAQSAINKWKQTWYDTGTKVDVSAFNLYRFFKEQEIATIFYQFRVINGNNTCVLYDQTHAVILKLHY